MTKLSSVVVAVLAALSGACSGAQRNSTGDAGGTEGTGGSGDSDGSSTGGDGGAGGESFDCESQPSPYPTCPDSVYCDADNCSDQSACAARVTEIQSWLAAPEPKLFGPRAGSTCLARVECGPQGCGMEGTFPPEYTFRGPTGCFCHHTCGVDFVLGGPDEQCDLYGRGPEQCAVPASAFEGCDPEVATSCEAACEAAEASMAADRAVTFDVEVRYAACLEDARFIGEGCRAVVRVDGDCWVTGWGHLSVAPGEPQASIVGPVDCSQGDESILATAYPFDECVARPDGEWGGMQVCPPYQAYCDIPEQCGVAMACIDGGCGPCTADDQCAATEGCVLDHCVLTPNISCRTYLDCDAGELCVLSGYTGGMPRGNEDMLAYCQ